MPNPDPQDERMALATRSEMLSENVRTVLARRRGELKLSLQQVADRAGLTKAHVWEIERGGSRNTTVSSIVGLASALQISEAELLGFAPAPDMLEALKGVVRVADRKTVEFDAAHAAIARAERLGLAALRAQPERAADDDVTPAMIAAAWGAWRVRHPHLRMGPGPGFSEAISAAFKARALPLSPVGEGE